MLAFANDAALARVLITATAVPAARVRAGWATSPRASIRREGGFSPAPAEAKARAAAQRRARLPPGAFRAWSRACPRGLERSPDAWYPADQVHHCRHYSMPPLRRPRRGPKPDRRRAPELLAASRDGATEAIMLAHGFTVEQMVDMCIAGLATAIPQLTQDPDRVRSFGGYDSSTDVIRLPCMCCAV
jgi:hypothetical protein